MLGQKFGNPKRTGLPVTYLGMRHEMLSPGHLLVHQQHYLEKLPEAKFTNACSEKDWGLPSHKYGKEVG
eukprot:9498639-Pyramimonas_sp.AAC.2